MARFALLALVIGCSFDSAKLAGDANGEAPVPDAGPCSELGDTCAGTELRRCTVLGAPPVIEQCAWTCLDGPPPHCGELAPSGGALLSTDFETSTLADVTFPGDAIVDTDNGRIGTSANGTSVRSPGVGIINGIDFQLRGTIAVFRMKSLVMSGSVEVIGSEAIAIVTGGETAIRGVVDLRDCSGPMPGPGGFAGGAAGSSGIGNGAGAGGQGNNGGGGGGAGGAGGNGAGGTAGGPIFGDPTISLLAGGGGGGGGGGIDGGTGGGGGGAIQLVSTTRVVIEALGGINAGGCGGTAGTTGAGGGAGGTILIEAPVVEIAGPMAVNGGGGGGGNNDGLDGSLDRVRANGGNANAGDGAAGSILGGGAGAQGAGGGGGIGRIRIHTRSGAANITGVLSPDPSDANTTCTVEAAKLK